jgi:hypothetical protein
MSVFYANIFHAIVNLFLSFLHFIIYLRNDHALSHLFLNDDQAYSIINTY